MAKATGGEEELITQGNFQPHEINWLGQSFQLYQGFWYPSILMQAIKSFQNHFEVHDSDIILASKPKTGTTWLKSLVFSIVNRQRYSLAENPLLKSNPHELVPYFELNLYLKNLNPDLSDIPAPRLLSTHLAYSSLSESIKKSKCPIVYVCRNPFDVFVSTWHFFSAETSEGFEMPSVEKVFEQFCQGFEPFGPFCEHVLEYWKESKEKPNRVLFLKYEDLKEDTIFHLKRLAEFLGYPFSLEEEKEGKIQEIADLCSFEKMKDLEVNKTGKLAANFHNKNLFRKAVVGDWVNLLTPSMEESFKKVMQEKLKGSGLTFKWAS